MPTKKLKPWNGKFGQYQYDPEKVKYWKMQIGEDNTIYYTNADGEINIWCPGSQLLIHLHHLKQIEARA